MSRLRRSVVLIGLVVCFNLAGLGAEPIAREHALGPRESAAMLSTADTFVAELLVAEPLVVDPVEAVFDDAGRLWVVEMRDYPSVKENPTGRIRILEDSTGDGMYDRAVVFAEQLDMPTGLALWKDGAIVTVAGRLLFLRDTTADGTCDQTLEWWTGFARANEQLRANHPRIGLDGWCYVANGLRGGQLVAGVDLASKSDRISGVDSTAEKSATGLQPIDIRNRDVRLNLFSKDLERITGPAQFGLSFDQIGGRYFCSNRNPAVHVELEQSDLTGNPLAGIVSSTRDVLPAGAASKVWPLVNAWTTSNLHAGQFTAACGVFLRHRPNGLEEVFVCEPTGCLVKREILDLNTGTPVMTKRNEPNSGKHGKSEWLASRDPWFRPVNVGLAPDDSLLIVDMHRAVIEHPQWVPEELKQRPDQRWGDECGRVYVVRNSGQIRLSDRLAELQQNPLASRSSAQLITHLADGQWMRDTAGRILLERGERDSVPGLIAFALQSKFPIAARVAAIQLAITLGGAMPMEFGEFLKINEKPLLQMAVLRFGQADRAFLEKHRAELEVLAVREGPAQRAAILALSPQSFSVHCRELARSAVFSMDPYLLVAVGHSMDGAAGDFFLHWLDALQDAAQVESLHESWLQLASAELARFLATRSPSNLEPLLMGIQQGLDVEDSSGNVRTLAGLSALQALIGQEVLDGSKLHLADLLELVVELAFNDTQTESVRIAALRVLETGGRTGCEQLPAVEGRLSALARGRASPGIVGAALRAWSELPGSDCGPYLLKLVGSGSPTAKRVAVELIARRPARIKSLVSAIQDDVLMPRSLSVSQWQTMQRIADPKIQTALRDVLSELVDTDRDEVISRYGNSLRSEGNVEAGRELFQRHCSVCHRIDGIGRNVGPDISDSRTKSREQLLVSILNPNLVIDNNYYRFVALTADDRVVEGLIVEETSDAVVILTQESTRVVLQKSEIVQLKATGVSLMPEGLESQITPEQMSDLISYIKGWRYQGGEIPAVESR